MTGTQVEDLKESHLKLKAAGNEIKEMGRNMKALLHNKEGRTCMKLRHS